MSNELINYIKKVSMKTVLHFFWLFPIDDNKITLLNELSYTYGDSMKYLDIYIHNSDNRKYRVVFPIKTGAKPTDYADDIIVKPGSFKYFKELLTSSVIITNAGGVSYLPKRKKQKIISTWHGGGPYKKTSTDVFNNRWYKKQADMNSDNTDYMLSTCKNFSEVEAVSMGYKPNQIIPAGLPRNDIIFKNPVSVSEKVRKFYNIPSDKKFILFAPTFRSKNNEFSNANIVQDYVELDVDNLLLSLKERFDCEWVCGIRLHPKLANVDMSSLNVINCTTYPDMQELLCCADAIITDYSSLMWDYSFTYRPVFLYAPDIESYERERGFYMPVSEWPYPIAHDNDEMRKNILEFDEDTYVKRVKAHHMICESYETGNACKVLMDLIKK